MNIEYTTQGADSFVGKQSCYYYYSLLFFFFTFSGPFLSISCVFYRPDFSLEAEEKSEENQCF